MKVTVEPTDIETIREWTMKIKWKHESNPEWIASITAKQNNALVETFRDITIYTNTKGVNTRRWTWSAINQKEPTNSQAMHELNEARAQLMQKAKEQAEYMAQNESISDNKRIESKTNETIISLRYIDDEW